MEYNDVDQVADQLDEVRQAVLKYKDHPALLAWGLGNEMEGFENGDDAAIWSHVGAAASLVKQLDPDHPTMTTVAEVGGARIKSIHRLCPDIDIVGINSYGGATSLPGRYLAAVPEGYEAKPFVVTEFGPPGTWEVEMNSFGVPEELTSTQKAEFYARSYEALEASPETCLGSFAFLWGSKREATSTWFGMFLADGSKVAAVDTMADLWGGSIDSRCPVIEPLSVDRQVGKPGDVINVSTDVSDPDGDSIEMTWTLEGEQATYFTGGDTQPQMQRFPEAVKEKSKNGCKVVLPETPGVYRLYAVAKDGQGSAATATVPLLVEVEAAVEGAEAAKLPLRIIGDDAESPYVPSGWMGSTESIQYEPGDTSNPHTGKTASRINFTADSGWGGIVWQSPANDWGDVDGGLDLTGATTLTVWARGAQGGEKVIFGFGGIGRDKPFFDTAQGQIDVVLTKDWKQYTIPLKGHDLSRIKSGFRWSAAAVGAPFTFYLDDVRYE